MDTQDGGRVSGTDSQSGDRAAGIDTPGGDTAAGIDTPGGEPGGWRSSEPGVHQLGRTGAAALGPGGRGRGSAEAGAAGWVESVRLAERPDGAGRWRFTAVGRWGAPPRGRARAVVLALALVAAVIGAARLVQPPGVAASVPAPGISAAAQAGDRGRDDGRSLGVGAEVPDAPGEAQATQGSTPGALGEPAGTPASGPSGATASSGPGQSTSPPAVAGAEPALQGVDWWSVVAELDARRSEALETADPAGLAGYAQPGSAAWRADEALIADLAARGLRPLGLRAAVMAIERAEVAGSEVRLQVVDQRSAYDLIDVDGSVHSRVEAAGPARWSIVLAPVQPREGEAPGASDPAVAPGTDADAEPDPERAGVEPEVAVDPGWRVVSVELLSSGGVSP